MFGNLQLCRSTGDNCGDYDYSNGECCPPERQKALSSSCSASLDVCCLHPNSTEQYSPANLNSLGCAPSGGPARTTPGTPEYEEEVDYQECSVDECRLFGDRCCEEKPETCSEEDQLLGFCQDQGLTGVTCSEEDQLLGFCVNPPVIPEPRCGTRNAFGAGPVPVSSIINQLLGIETFFSFRRLQALTRLSSENGRMSVLFSRRRTLET